MASWCKSLAFVLLALTAIGCDRVFPVRADLGAVHDAYRSEFASSFIPAANPARPREETCRPLVGEASFAKTRQAIRDFRVKYGTDRPESAHLTVLEGMLFLQAGNTGKARLHEANVKKAKDKLVSGTGHLNRDYLFADSFGLLIAGWEIICDRLKAGFVLEPGEVALAMKKTADAIEKKLVFYKKEGKLASPEADEGGIYLATTAAIFYSWTYKFFVDACLLPPEPCPAKADTTHLEAGHDLIGSFLSPAEISLAEDYAGAPIGRLRYIMWYNLLGKMIENPTG